jgi:hypothetical protein
MKSTCPKRSILVQIAKIHIEISIVARYVDVILDQYASNIQSITFVA